MNIQIVPHILSGTVSAIPSKSQFHRALICAAFADKPTQLAPAGQADDIRATMACLEALGAGFREKDSVITVTPVETPITDNGTLYCGESGSTLRFMLPVAAALGGTFSLHGEGRLPQRPLDVLMDVLSEHGILFSKDRLPLSIRGQFVGGDVYVPGHVSSQFVSGLLLSAPLTEKGMHIHLLSPLQSQDYVAITIETMAHFGVHVEKIADGFSVSPTARYMAPDHVLTIEGDWSNAAFFLAAGALAGRITVSGLNIESTQGDRAIIEILKAFGAIVAARKNAVTVEAASLRGMAIDVSDIPDLVPVLAIVAAQAEGDTYFTNAKRLRIKESNRLEGTASLISDLGGQAEVIDDTLIVHGGKLHGGSTSSRNDHRMVMSAAVAAIGCSKSVTITGVEAVNKSYPHFFDDYRQLGGNAHELTLW